MNRQTIRARAIALYDRFTHEHLDRRAFMAELVALAGSAAGANALLTSIAADPARAALTAPDDKRLVIRKGPYALPGHDGEMKGYFASPRVKGKKLPAVMVIHENRGLNAHIEDVARRLALDGFFVCAPDFLSIKGGTPPDEDHARALIAELHYPDVVAQAIGTLARLKKLDNTNGKAGLIGFCWGGALVDRVLIAPDSPADAGVSYYGMAPSPEDAPKLRAPLLMHLAGNDSRVNATATPWAEALKRAGKPAEAYTYPGVDHAFNNDSSAARYNKAAADLAWDRTIAFLKKYLAE
ncbi:dienelactone hydrolase family protein [Sphingomonas sp. C3-2]|uniref:dienelactone hydrolase family protein n=1 Tax=Sphingomonas sp. C3-2 TaxID=3062169 RepID=UPI00294AD153|nr:dienelactone hydrolase family protein [Sphingomonas sp. C3-2]WOK36324.1 dienelactone hydrolase family protein [Sphingomonas sp. C3-2]